MNVGVLLAGGASRRMGGPKALARSGSVSFTLAGVRALWSACETVIVVLGANARSIRPALERELETLAGSGRLHGDVQRSRKGGARGLELRFVVNARWRDGMVASVRVGLRAALRLGPAGVLVLPVDHPNVRRRTIEVLAGVMEEALASFGASSAGRRQRAAFPYALVPRHRRRRGHPVALSPALAAAVARDRAAHDLGDAIRRHARLMGFVDVDDPGILRNRNAPED